MSCHCHFVILVTYYMACVIPTVTHIMFVLMMNVEEFHTQVACHAQHTSSRNI